MVFEKIQTDGHEQVVFCRDPSVGLKAIIAIHSQTLGPALGGCRNWDYSSDEEGLQDVLNLSKGMTYKSSISGLNWGGGKAVIFGSQKTPRMMERFGEFVQRLGGNYITAKDVGTDEHDLRMIHRKTKYVVGIKGDPGSSGDPSPVTALGVYSGMKACAEFSLGSASLKGRRIAIQGLGSVGSYLIEYLAQEGAILFGSDVCTVKAQKIKEMYPIQIVAPDQIYDIPADIFSPCAMGGSINEKTIPLLKAKIVAGAANNQLASAEDGVELFRRGIVYAPDYAINAGGVINIYYENFENKGYSKIKALEHVSKIRSTVELILERSKQKNLPTHEVADHIAEERIDRALSEKTQKPAAFGLA